jgi:23S rRNA pseudouridine1911/1915/1917 synthase
MESQSIVVDEISEGQRIDVLISQQLSNISRSFAQKMIQDGCVLVNGDTVKANYRVQLRDVVQVSRPEVQPLEVTPEVIPLDIVL